MRYAIGDIHGGCQTFKALISSIELRAGDRLYLLGDYVDRGNDSRGVLDTIMSMAAAGYDLRPVRGNHDDMFLRALQGSHDSYSPYWEREWGELTLSSFGVTGCREVPPAYLNFLDSLPLLRCEDDFVFVHAAINMACADPLAESSDLEMLWGETTVVDHNKLGGRRLVTGHRIRRLAEIVASLQTDHIRLDNGAFTNQLPDYGHLLALNLDTMALALQPWLDGDTVW
jgi:serine/threonine protein phosphatase 1